MTDERQPIFEAITTLLDPMVVPVYSFVPANEDHPYIFIGELDTEQVENKSQFEIRGFINVIYFSGTNAPIDSYQTALKHINEMKVRLQPYTSFVLPLDGEWGMVFWRKSSDTGIQEITEIERVYTCTVTYEFELTHDLTYWDRVTLDGGTIEAFDCVLDKTFNT
jgi:hypothetical protein